MKVVHWLSGRVLDSRQRGPGFEPHQCHFVVSWSKNINPSLVLVQPRKTRPFITERLLMGLKESNQTKTNKQNYEKVYGILTFISIINTTSGSNKARKTYTFHRAKKILIRNVIHYYCTQIH